MGTGEDFLYSIEVGPLQRGVYRERSGGEITDFEHFESAQASATPKKSPVMQVDCSQPKPFGTFPKGIPSGVEPAKVQEP
jgi:hypothetical protein